MLAAGADYSDVQRVLTQIHDMSQWPHAWLGLAHQYECQAREAVHDQNFTTAGEALLAKLCIVILVSSLTLVIRL